MRLQQKSKIIKLNTFFELNYYCTTAIKNYFQNLSSFKYFYTVNITCLSEQLAEGLCSF